MKREPQMTYQTLQLLTAAASCKSEVSGAMLMRMTQIRSGTAYPILARLEAAGWLKSRWEDVEASKVKRPRRRLYRILAAGRKALEAAQHGLRPSNQTGDQ